MKQSLFKYLLFSVFFSALFTSCVEDDGWDELEDEGTNSILFSEGPESINYFSPFTDVKKVDAFILMRDVTSNAELQKSPIIQLSSDPSIIDNYNEEHGESYELLPNDFYSLANTNFEESSNGGYAITLEGGSFAEAFTINLDGSKWVDLSKKYALAFRIQDAPGLVNKAGQDSILVLFATKNQWDGIYSVVDGNVQRYTAPGVPTVDDALNGSMAGNADVTLATINANTVEITGLRWHGNASGIAGIDNLRATIDPTTNQVTMTALGNASLRNIPSAVNTYDPATKTFTLNFEWNPTANRRAITGLVLKYKGDR